MISDPFTEDKSQGVIYTLAAVVLLVIGAIAISIYSDRSAAPSDLSQSKYKLEKQKLNLLSKISELEAEKLVAEKNEKDSQRYAEIEKEMQSLMDREAQALEVNTQASDQLISLLDAYANYQRSYILQMRDEVVGETYDLLETASGREYTEVTIQRVSAYGVDIKHTNGTARLAHAEIPADLANRLSYSEEELEAVLKASQQRRASSASSPVVAAKPRSNRPARSGRVVASTEQKQKDASQRSALRVRLSQVQVKLTRVRDEIGVIEGKLNKLNTSTRSTTSSSYSSNGYYTTTRPTSRYKGSRSVPGGLETWSQRLVRFKKAERILAMQEATLSAQLESL
ncbi:hypothetical protein [Persicirhabdus sediminis]|uniref:Uncharacterized protein n=1 Tax=Persicirhabdus sediminis TaxID=454144 RepID=A0A8J7ME43_9BACT|nr:hypothetical protein [Persicirhabdus sediminis]MBK1791078.1 hypothetical protein [Persicirhabdus sediminis]